MPMSAEQGFLDAIIAEPGDDALRLIYADWLDDHGQPDRAQFIRVQVELAHLAADPDADSVRVATRRAREHRLLAAHHREWLGPDPSVFGNGWGFRRGFVERLAFTPVGFAEHAEELSRRTPL